MKTRTKEKIKQESWIYFKLFMSFLLIAWIVITITFILIHSVPGSSLSGNKDSNQIQVLNRKYGLDKPLVVQYFIFIAGLFKGDFGISYSINEGTPINSFLWSRMAVSFKIGIIAVLLGISIGIIVGILIGIKPGGWADNIGTIVISLGIAIPSFVAGLLLMLLGQRTGIPYIYDRTNILSIFLPAFALAISTIIVYMRYLRTELNTQLSSNHYKFAKVKGVSKMRFIVSHALKPSLLPVISFLPAAILGAFIGSMFVEGIYNIPGSGSLMIDAINAKDYNVIQAIIIISVLTTIISFFLRDIMYRLLDPRVRR